MLNQATQSYSPVTDNAGGELHQLAMCVDCGKPLINKTWKERLKGQLRRRFPWLSKKRHELPFGQYAVKQCCTECRKPLRCSECSEAFFSNLSPVEIRVFLKAIVLYAMKAQCQDCNDPVRLVYEELFEDPYSNPRASPRASPRARWFYASPCASPTARGTYASPCASPTAADSDSNQKQSYSGRDVDESAVDPKVGEILNENSNGERRKRVRFADSNDSKRDHLGNTLQQLLER